MRDTENEGFVSYPFLQVISQSGYLNIQDVPSDHKSRHTIRINCQTNPTTTNPRGGTGARSTFSHILGYQSEVLPKKTPSLYVLQKSFCVVDRNRFTDSTHNFAPSRVRPHHPERTPKPATYTRNHHHDEQIPRPKSANSPTINRPRNDTATSSPSFYWSTPPRTRSRSAPFAPARLLSTWGLQA